MFALLQGTREGGRERGREKERGKRGRNREKGEGEKTDTMKVEREESGGERKRNR